MPTCINRGACGWSALMDAEILPTGPRGTNLSEISIEINIYVNAPENVVCEMSVILSRLQCVKVASLDTVHSYSDIVKLIEVLRPQTTVSSVNVIILVNVCVNMWSNMLQRFLGLICIYLILNTDTIQTTYDKTI